MTYSTVKGAPIRLVTIPAERAFEVIEMNKQGRRPESLQEEVENPRRGSRSSDILADNSLTRFDRSGRRPRKGEGRPRRTEGDSPRGERPSRRGEVRPNAEGGGDLAVRQFRSPRTRRPERSADPSVETTPRIPTDPRRGKEE